MQSPARAQPNTRTNNTKATTRRALIAESLKKDPQLSNREHERRTGASHARIQRDRKKLEELGQLDHWSSRVGADGRERPASQPKRESAPDQQPHEPAADELNTPNPPRIPDPVAPPPATTTEDKPPTQGSGTTRRANHPLNTPHSPAHATKHTTPPQPATRP